MTHLPIETPRLLLRKPAPADADIIQQLANDPLVAENTLKFPHPYTLNHAEQFIRRAENAWRHDTEYNFAVTLRASGAYIGSVGVFTKAHDIGEIGYWIGAPYRGEGYATEAVRAALGFSFDVLGCNRIQALSFTQNPASRRVQEKAGMQFEGVLRGHIHKDGRYEDATVCAVLRRDYEVDHANT